MPAPGKCRGLVVGLPGVVRALPSRPREGSPDRRRPGLGPPVARAHHRAAPVEEAGPGRVVGAVDDQAPPLVAVSLAGWGTGHVEHARGGIEARGQTDPHRGRQVGPSDGGLDRRDRDELGDEAVVVGGQLAVHAVRVGVGQEVAGQSGSGVVAPRVGLGVPGEGAGRDQASGFLGDGVVVGRGAMAAEGREVLLVPPDLVQRPRRWSRRGHRPWASRRAVGAPTPTRSGGRRARCRWSSGRRRGTGWRPTRSAAGGRRARRRPRRRSASTPPRAPSGGGAGRAPRPTSRCP